MPFVVGEQVGPYRVVEQLGRGGMSTVYKAYHAALDRYVALKVLHPVFKGDRDFMERFQREARIVARLEHPHIVPVYDFSEHEDTPYLVMRYVEGHTLKALLPEEGALPLPRIVQVLRPVCDALAYAHGQGVLHRDIKPSNVLLSEEGRVYVTDFGLAKMAQAGDSSISQDRMIGTPQYISPEQAKGAPVDLRTDLYSLGVVLFEMLTGRVPYAADTPFAVVHDHIYSPLPMPSSLNPQVSPAVEQVVLKALAKEPADRYQSAGEFQQALEAAAGLAPAAQAEAWDALLTPAEPRPLLEVLPAEALPAEASVEAVPQVEPRPAVGVAPAGPLPAEAPVEAAPEVESLAEWAVGEPVPAAEAVPAEGVLVETGAEAALGAEPPAGGAAAAARPTRRVSWLAVVGMVVGALVLLLILRAVLVRRELTAQDLGLGPDYPRLGEERWPEEELEAILQEKRAWVASDPQNPEAFWFLGNVLYDMRNWTEAAEAYQRAVELDPGMALAHFNLGVTFLQLEEPDPAIEHFRLAVQLDPGLDLESLYGVGAAHALAGRYGEAIGAFERFLEVYPRNDPRSRRVERIIRLLRLRE